MFQATETRTPEAPRDQTAGLNYTSMIASARAVIDLALSESNSPIVTTKFGPYSAGLLHMLIEEAPGIPVVWIDTGFNTRATMQFADHLTGLLDLNLKVFKPAVPWQGFVPDIEEADHSRFTAQVKLEPFSRALDTLAPDMWFRPCAATRPNTAARNPISTSRTTPC